MNTRKSRSLTLEFQPTLDDARGRKELRDGLSAVLQIGSTLWVANDESASVERLELAGDKAGDHVQFELRDYLDLAVEPDEGPTPEIDIEGMDWSEGYLWVVGSHSLKRCNPDPGDPPAQVSRQLARVETDANRYLLARIPLREQDGLPVPVRKEKPRRAQRLRGGPRDNALTRLLRKDKHLGAFLGLPGKDNGFDIEGMAVAGEHVFLGLRGPVARASGWSCRRSTARTAPGYASTSWISAAWACATCACTATTCWCWRGRPWPWTARCVCCAGAARPAARTRACWKRPCWRPCWKCRSARAATMPKAWRCCTGPGRANPRCWWCTTRPPPNARPAPAACGSTCSRCERLRSRLSSG